MAGTVILSVPEKDTVEQLDSGIIVTHTKDVGSTEVALVLSAGEDCGDIKDGSKILYQTNTGFKLDKGVYYLKYADIIALIEE